MCRNSEVWALVENGTDLAVGCREVRSSTDIRNVVEKSKRRLHALPPFTMFFRRI
jgi:hypothetical protein